MLSQIFSCRFSVAYDNINNVTLNRYSSTSHDAAPDSVRVRKTKTAGHLSIIHARKTKDERTAMKLFRPRPESIRHAEISRNKLPSTFASMHRSLETCCKLIEGYLSTEQMAVWMWYASVPLCMRK